MKMIKTDLGKGSGKADVIMSNSNYPKGSSKSPSDKMPSTELHLADDSVQCAGV